MENSALRGLQALRRAGAVGMRGWRAQSQVGRRGMSASTVTRVGRSNLSRTGFGIVAVAIGAVSVYQMTPVLLEEATSKPALKQAEEVDPAKHPGAAGTGRLIPMDEVRQHDIPSDLWVVIDGKVWDVTDFYNIHPGGSKIILANGGKDVTSLFKPIHPAQTLERTLDPKTMMGLVDPDTLPKGPDEYAEEQKRIKEERENMPPVETMLGIQQMIETAERLLTKKGKMYYRTGSDDEVTLRDNSASFLKCRFIPRILRNVASIRPQTTIFGQPSTLPIYISPASNALLGNEEGEFTLVRGAAATGIVQGISAVASLPLDEILEEKERASTANGREMSMVYQVYVQTDRAKTEALIEEAIEGGVKALLLTVDSAVLGNRQNNDMLKGHTGDASPGIRDGPHDDYVRFHDPSFQWEDLQWLKDLAGELPIYLKGVAAIEDVRRAQKEGLAGVILSNHGGRQLDRSRTGFDSLRAIAREDPQLLKDFEVYVDGGVRRGNDALVALALGARGVGLGRPFLYAQTAYGDKGVIRAVRILEQEIVLSMRLLGIASLSELKPEMVECLQENWGR